MATNLKYTMTVPDGEDAPSLQLEQSIRQQIWDVERRLNQIRAVAEIAQLANSEPKLEELYDRVTHIVGTQFDYPFAAIYLLDDTQKDCVLVSLYSTQENPDRVAGIKTGVGSRSMVGWVAAHNQIKLAKDVAEEYFYQEDSLLQGVKSAAVFPISMGDTLMGVLEVRQTILKGFDPEAVTLLQIVASHVAHALRNYQLREASRDSMKGLSLLYEVSNQLTQVKSPPEVFQVLKRALAESTFYTVILSMEGEQVCLYSILDPDKPGNNRRREVTKGEIENIHYAQVSALFATEAQLFVVDPQRAAGYPKELMAFYKDSGCQTVALVPILYIGKLRALIMLGTRQRSTFTPEVLHSFTCLAGFVRASLEKMNALEKVERQAILLTITNAVSQAIAMDTNLYPIFKTIHKELRRLMGNVEFLVVGIDPDRKAPQLAFTSEKEVGSDHELHIPGEKLVARVIKNGQPLLFSENAAEVIQEAGENATSKPVKSWLGVPLKSNGEICGAIIVLDRVGERRFEEDDINLISILAPQVVASMRYSSQLQTYQNRINREKQLHEISSKIRHATDMRSVLEITANELANVLDIRRAHLEIGIRPPAKASPKKNPKPQENSDG